MSFCSTVNGMVWCSPTIIALIFSEVIQIILELFACSAASGRRLQTVQKAAKTHLFD